MTKLPVEAEFPKAYGKTARFWVPGVVEPGVAPPGLAVKTMLPTLAPGVPPSPVPTKYAVEFEFRFHEPNVSVEDVIAPAGATRAQCFKRLRGIPLRPEAV